MTVGLANDSYNALESVLASSLLMPVPRKPDATIEGNSNINTDRTGDNTYFRRRTTAGPMQHVRNKTAAGGSGIRLELLRVNA